MRSALTPALASPAPRHCRNTASALGLAAFLAAAPLAAAPVPPKPSPTRKPVAAPKRPPAAPAKPAARPASPAKPALATDASTAFFRDGVVPRLKIQISDAEMQKLRQQERSYVRCTVIEDDRTQYQDVGIHLKGAAGSFRGVDDRPALTLNFDKYKEGQVFHDLDKVHLNNSVQDPGYLNELVCSELFLAAGIPAARATHARVWLNGRDLGLYVFKEGFNKRFLKRHFADASGNLYEGGFLQDIDAQPKLLNGSGPTDGSDVKALVDACREGDPAKRWERVERLVDVDRFLTFRALELLTCHWDGYNNTRNNYRFYFEPKSGKVQFFPHGMDQMFSDPGFSLFNASGSIVGNAVMSNPAWQSRYRELLAALVKRFVPADRLQNRVEEHHARLRPVLAQMGPQAASEFDQRVRELKDRLTARAQSLLQQTQSTQAQRPPSPAAGPETLRFTAAGVATVTGWEPRLETADARLEKVAAQPGVGPARLAIAAGPGGRCVASWRTTVVLAAGKYRFEARARAQGVQALNESKGAGAGIRISGSDRTNKLDGTSGWTLLKHEFEVQEPSRSVELVAELRATAGQAAFDAASLRLVRVSK
jgi:spore coat protein H